MEAIFDDDQWYYDALDKISLQLAPPEAPPDERMSSTVDNNEIKQTNEVTSPILLKFPSQSEKDMLCCGENNFCSASDDEFSQWMYNPNSSKLVNGLQNESSSSKNDDELKYHLKNQSKSSIVDDNIVDQCQLNIQINCINCNPVAGLSCSNNENYFCNKCKPNQFGNTYSSVTGINSNREQSIMCEKSAVSTLHTRYEPYPRSDVTNMSHFKILHQQTHSEEDQKLNLIRDTLINSEVNPENQTQSPILNANKKLDDTHLQKVTDVRSNVYNTPLIISIIKAQNREAAKKKMEMKNEIKKLNEDSFLKEEPTKGIDSTILKLCVPRTVTCHQNFKLLDCDLTYLTDDTMEYINIHRKIKVEANIQHQVASIHRIENPYLWGMYLLMKEEMKLRYGHCSEQILYHGTKTSYVNNIILNNFDWRQSGKSRGHIHGRGVYFTKNIRTGSMYAENSMFVVRVLICWMQHGQKSTLLPSHECDTTVSVDGEITVKYDDFTFYPEYLVTFVK